MSKELIEETKKAMGYVEQTPMCCNCTFHIEEEVHSRDWMDMCTFSNVQSFSVKKQGSCKKFVNKKI